MSSLNLKSKKKASEAVLVSCEVRDSIAYFILNNPPANLMNEQWSGQAQNVIDHISRLAEKGMIRGVILHGLGRHYSAGANLESLEQAVVGMKENYLARMLRNSAYFEKLHDVPVPVVAAIRGVCIGSGLELGLACHYRICDERSVLGSVEATFGIMPGCGATVRLQKLVGTGCSLELVMSGRRLDARESLELGIVDEVVHHNGLLNRAEAYIEKLWPWYQASYQRGEQ